MNAKYSITKNVEAQQQTVYIFFITQNNSLQCWKDDKLHVESHNFVIRQ